MRTAFTTTFLAGALVALIGSAARSEPPQGIAAAIQPLVDKHEIAGTVTLVADKDKVRSLEAVGYADVAAKKPMRAGQPLLDRLDDQARNGTAVLMLQDEGTLSVDDPVAKYLPELADLKTAGGKPAKMTLRHSADAHVRHGRGDTARVEGRRGRSPT